VTSAPKHRSKKGEIVHLYQPAITVHRRFGIFLPPFNVSGLEGKNIISEIGQRAQARAKKSPAWRGLFPN
jgi:hypothetical protein